MAAIKGIAEKQLLSAQRVDGGGHVTARNTLSELTACAILQCKPSTIVQKRIVTQIASW